MKRHLLIAAMMVYGVATPPVCVGQVPAATRDSTPWVNDRALTEKLKDGVDSFFGDARGNYHTPYPGEADPSLVSTQFSSAFFGVPVEGRPRTLPDGKKMYIGCKPHDCEIKAALVTEADGVTPIAAALIHSFCEGTTTDAAPDGSASANSRCARTGVTVFFPHKSSLDTNLRAQFESWARTAISASRASELPSSRTETVEIEIPVKTRFLAW
jgi:hypothetical protein